jgi:hypothetical protein
MAEFQSIREQGILEGIRATEHKGDEIIAPKIANIRDFIDEFSVPPNPVPADIGADIDCRAEGR